MTSRFLTLKSLALAVALALAAPLGAQTVVNTIAPSTNTDPGVWYASYVTASGTVGIVDPAGPGGPLPTGAARLTTTTDNNDRANIGIFDSYGTPNDLFATLNLGYSCYKASNGTQNLAAAPSLKLTFYNPVCDDVGSAGDCFGVLVFEPTWNQPGFEGSSVSPPLDTWQTFNIDQDNGLFWWTGGFGQPNTAGGPPLRTLAQWKAVMTSDFGDSSLALIEVGVGSYNQNQLGYVDNVTISHAFGGGYSRWYDFEAPLPEDEVQPDVIFGGGNANGSFTIDRDNGVELGLRGKLRYPASNVFNSNGDGTYTFNTGSGTGPAGDSEWSFEWSVNTNYDGSAPARKVGDLTYEIGMDNDPGAGTDYLVFDPVSIGTIIPYTLPAGPIPYWDHSMGDNTTPNGGGVEAGDGVTYAGYLATYNVAQNSWRPTFYQNTAPYAWNPNVPGRYDYYLAAYSGATELARTSIAIIVTDGLTMTLEADPCQTDHDPMTAGVQMAVELWLRNPNDVVVTGWQSFLAFDPMAMDFEGALSSYSALPFGYHIQAVGTAEVAPGELRLDGNTFSASGPNGDALLATLVFTVDECDSNPVAFDLTQSPFNSEFSYVGVPYATNLLDSSAIVADDTAPVLAPHANITQSADAGSCSGAVVSYTAPIATDNCDPSPTVTCSPASGSTFPVGTTTVTCTATDDCGNESTSTFDVTVTATNLVTVDVELVGVNAAVSRCLHFTTDVCASNNDVTVAFTDHDSDLGVVTPVRGTATFTVPCGVFTSLCAKDEQHTKWNSVGLAPSMDGSTWEATSLLSLDAGDTDNDGDVDINDVTWYLAQFGQLSAPGGCPWDDLTRDADFSNNGAIGSEDYSFLVTNWLTTSGCVCPLSWTPAGSRLRLEVMAKVQTAVQRKADLNGDGVIDDQDVEIFETRHGLSGELSGRMRASLR